MRKVVRVFGWLWFNRAVAAEPVWRKFGMVMVRELKLRASDAGTVPARARGRRRT